MSSVYGDFNRYLVEDLRANGGRPSGGPFKGRDLLILTTRGSKSGETRVTPLVYSRDGDRLVILGSKGGGPTNPHWFQNLKTQPEVTVELLGEKFKAWAHVIEGDEYERLYKQHADINPTFHEYRRKTSRKIPVVVLERIVSKPTA